MIRLIAVLGLAAAAGLPSVAQSACYQLPVSSKADPFTYLSSVVDSLAMLNQGRLRMAIDRGTGPAEFVYALKAAGGDFSCAISTMKAFSANEDERIAESAQTIVMSYEMIAMASDALRQELVGRLDETSGVNNAKPEGAGTRANRVAELRTQIDDAWSSLLPAMAAASCALPMFKDGRPTGRFRITNAQRETLKRSLVKCFGPSIRAGIKAGQEYVVASAASLYGVLSEKKWRSSDS